MYTKEQLKEALKNAGICEGDDILVHSSYKSLGGIDGGARAVIEAFTEVLGESGTLLMPAFTFSSVTRDNPVFDYENSPNCVGYLGEFLRTEVIGVIRSVHATHSVCALGKRAEEYTKGHEKDLTPVGENSPITKLAKAGGKILMLGCSPNHLTIMHGVEETTPPDYVFDSDNPVEYILKFKDKEVRQTATRHLFVKDGFVYCQIYSRIINLLDRSEHKECDILDAHSHLFDAKAIWEKGSKKIKEEPYYFIKKRRIKMKTAYEFLKEKIQEQKQSMSYNGDLKAWQPVAREKLKELIGLDKFTAVLPETDIEYEKKIDGATEIRFTFKSEDDYRVPCHLLLPDGVENPPVIICLQGHSTGMHISLGRPKFEGDENSINGGDRDFCVRAVKEGFAAIAVEQRNFGECGGDETGPKCFESTLTALLMGRTTIAERVWDVCRLIDVLENEFADKVDINTICCMGNSGGGTATAYISALEDRIKLAMPSCAMCTFKDSIGAMRHCACNYVPHIAEFFDMGDLMAMSYPKAFVQVSGMEDSIFPVDAAEEVFNAGKTAYASMGKDDVCVFVKGNGGHRFYADDAWPHVHKILGK